jgi:hypothetical protein
MSVEAVNDCSNANRSIRYLLEMHIRIPARMVADVLISVKVKHLGDRAVDYC